LNVLHFTRTSGHHPFFIDLAKHFQHSNIRLFIGTLERGGDLQEALKPFGVPGLSLDCRGWRDFPGAVFRLAKLLRENSIDVVHTHLAEPSLVGLSAARLAGVPGRLMTRHHSDERIIYGSRRAVLLDRFIGRHLARDIVAISQAVRRALIEIDRVPEQKIRMVPNGYNWDRVQSSPEAIERVRSELGLEDCTVLCHVGRIAWVPARQAWMKGQDTLIRAFASAGLPSNTRVLIVGGGPQEELRALARERGVAERCMFLGFRRDVLDVMAASDLIVHPSLHEAQCHVLIEAMALGRTLISSNVGAAEEMVIPGENGWLIPPADEASLVAALRDALSDRQRLNVYGQRGQQLVRQLYPIERMLAGYEAVYGNQLRH
jgi:glycosyltransferase involved in cell wall biosynthesis